MLFWCVQNYIVMAFLFYNHSTENFHHILEFDCLSLVGRAADHTLLGTHATDELIFGHYVFDNIPELLQYKPS